MFNDPKNKKQMEAGKSQNRIGYGTVIEGELKSDGGFRIDGHIKGLVFSKAKVVIGQDGVIDGELLCENADIEGMINGKIEVNNLLSIKSTAKIDGEVTTSKLAVEPGASFNATCIMNKGVKSLNQGNRKENTA